METTFDEIPLVDHPVWRYNQPEGLSPEYFRFTAPKSWPQRPYNPHWNHCDDLVCGLFFAWNELPRSIIIPWTPLEEMQLLLRLDGLVTAFELYLPVTDNAFEHWTLRYQHAMEQGWTPGRNLMAATASDRAKGTGPWRRHQHWVNRYQYVVNLRNQVVRNRLRVNLGINRGEVGPTDVARKEWRGLRYPEILARRDWYKPLPWLLRAYAERIDKDPLEVATAFWRLVKPDETIEGLPRGYGMGVEISVMGNPRAAPQQAAIQKTLMGSDASDQNGGKNASGGKSLSLRETLEASRKEGRSAKRISRVVIDLTEDD